jgi:FKBP-type peptidyl-prolyl cis-trans isomerase FkpA
MKKTIISLTLLLLALFAGGCKNNGKAGTAAEGGEKLDADTSYAFGMLIATEFSLPGVTMDYDAFVKGYQAQVRGDTRFDMEEAVAKIQPVYMAAMERQALDRREEGDRFLEENGRKQGITVTPSGLQYEALAQGSGGKPGSADVVRVHYRGTLIDGTVFDSSYDRGEPVEFPLNGVIPGWTEGLQLMNEGGHYRFYIPSDLAYGDRGTGNIPPFAPLIFEVELLSIIGK